MWKDSSRAIERGASIVTVPYHPDSTLVILEVRSSIVLSSLVKLPRGNLESVHPRALTIDSIRRLLNRYHLNFFSLSETGKNIALPCF